MLKKFAAVLLALVLTLSTCTMVVAEEPEEVYDYQKEQEVFAERGNITFEDVDDDSNVNETEFQEMVALGKASSKRRATVHLDVHHYYQDIGDWATERMQSANLDIDTYGCTLTSFAMIVNYFKGSLYDPSRVNTDIGDNACDKKNGFIPDGAALAYNFSFTKTPKGKTYQEYIDAITGYIVTSKPVMVNMYKGDYTHTVLAYGVNSGTVYIHDPESHLKYSLLSTYMNNGWSIKTLYTFDD